MRLIKRGLQMALALACLFGIYAASIAFPSWAFRHEAGTDTLRIHAAEPLPPETRAFAEAVEAQLAASLVGRPDGVLHLYITGDGWRRVWFFGRNGFAGGVTYATISPDHAFLADGDIAADRMRKDGVLVPLPRSLTVYALHELAHLVTRARIGGAAYRQMDPVIREGIADYVALGPAPVALQQAITASYPEGADAALRDEWGSYPTARVAVTRLLEEGATGDELLAR